MFNGVEAEYLQDNALSPKMCDKVHIGANFHHLLYNVLVFEHYSKLAPVANALQAPDDGLCDRPIWYNIKLILITKEIFKMVPLIIYHLKNVFLVKTEKDREEAMHPGSLLWPITDPRLQLYFLLGLVYSTVTPILLPFNVIFFAFAYLVFCHQVINVYHQKYESATSFWSDVHRRILIGLIISQFTLLGLLSTKEATNLTPFLLVLPVLTF